MGVNRMKHHGPYEYTFKLTVEAPLEHDEVYVAAAIRRYLKKAGVSVVSVSPVITRVESVTLHEESWGGEDGTMTRGYRVGGLPDGQSWRVAAFGEKDWRVMRVGADGASSDSTGYYPSFEDALADLRS